MLLFGGLIPSELDSVLAFHLIHSFSSPHATPQPAQLKVSFFSSSPPLSLSLSLFQFFLIFILCLFVFFFFMYIKARETGHRWIGPSVFSRVFYSCPIVLWLKIWAWDLRVLVSWIFLSFASVVGLSWNLPPRRLVLWFSLENGFCFFGLIWDVNYY